MLRLAWHNGTLFANGVFAHAVPFGQRTVR